MVKPQASRPTYNNEQIEQYLEYINFPKDQRITKPEATTNKGLVFLTKLLKYQLAHIPFENLELHYSPHHTVSLDLDHLFHKIVKRKNGRGGYCMENNAFFGCILRSLGFNVMPVGARVSSAVNAVKDNDDEDFSYSGWSHAVNIITIEGKKYFCDVGFGSRGPTKPIPLEDGTQGINVGDESMGSFFRLAKENIADNTHSSPEQLLWVYSVRFDENMSWLPVYCFPEIEFLPGDFEIMSYHVSHSPKTWFTRHIVVQKFILSDDMEDVIGDVTLSGQDFKERRFGKSKTLCEIHSDSDRVAALEKYMSLKLSKAEINGIKGMVSMIG